MEKYIKIPSIYNKLKKAEAEYTPMYIYGMTGYGKTASVEYHLRRKAHLSLSGFGGSLNVIPDLNSLRESVVVIDDISWIEDEASKNFILRLLEQSNIWVILIGRSKLPYWLRMTEIKRPFIKASEEDLTFSEKEVMRLYHENGLDISNELCKTITEVSGGYAVFIILMMRRMADKESYDAKLIQATREDLFQYADSSFYQYWRDDLKEVLLAVCEYDYFTPEMIYALTKKDNVHEILDYAKHIGNFLKYDEANEYRFNAFLHRFLIWKKSLVYKPEDHIMNYRLAAEYYFNENKLALSAFYFDKIGYKEEVKKILLENAMEQVGRGQYFELRKYYYNYPEDEINEEPLLMSAMAMLYSMMLMPKESEEWYNRLCEYSKRKNLSKEKKNEADIRIAFLNVSLPHRGIKHIIKVIEFTAKSLVNPDLTMPELSITSNLPSIMNGGLDFCEWSKNTIGLERFLAKPLQTFLGNQGKGLVDIALAESEYEKNTYTELELTSKLQKGIMQAQAGGRIEIEFAGNGIMIKNYILRGKIDDAIRILQSFQKRVTNEKAYQLSDNMKVMHIWLSLLQGNVVSAEEWLKASTDENEEFCVLKRYQYIQKIRMLIAFGRYTQALNLVERLNYYFCEYQRTMNWIENMILKSVILYRLKDENWRTVFVNVIKKASEFHFVNVISIEGMAVKPLLALVDESDFDSDYINEVKNATNQMAKFYPDYLRYTDDNIIPLTDKEKEILKLMIAGASSEEICKECNISYNSLKFHNKNIYKKLGVKSRQEAERKGINMKLV